MPLKGFSIHPKWECNRCGEIWNAQQSIGSIPVLGVAIPWSAMEDVQTPQTCAQCRSLYWNSPRVRKVYKDPEVTGYTKKRKDDA